jgi:dTDP-D-glucose 4,6-dehydratase
MRLLVTGGVGYIGSVVAELAQAAGHDVVVIDDLRLGHRAAVPAGCRFVEGGIGDPAALAQVFGQGPIDAVIHLAAEAAIEFSVTNPALFFKTNLTESLRGKDESANRSAAKLIDNAKLSADVIAGRVLTGVEKGRHIILTDRDGRIAYAAKRFARPLYYSMMAKASVQMSKKD